MPPISAAAHPPATTNGSAIAALILGVIGAVVPAIPLGIVALVQIRRQHQRGRGMAIGGLVASGLWSVGIVAFVLLVVVGTAERDDDGTIAQPGSVSVLSLRDGDCIADDVDDVVGSVVFTVDVVPCTTPHSGEVYAVFDLNEGAYPGDDDVIRLAEGGCIDRLATAVPATVAEDLSLETPYFHPSSQSWSDGDREVVCMLFDPDGGVVGSFGDR